MSDSQGPSASGEARYSTSTSRSLLDRIRAGDPAAWDRLVDLYAPLVYRWCRRWGLPEQEIADILQDVFQAVASHIGAFRKEKPDDTFRGWLRTIAHNKVRDHYRRQGHEPGGAGGTEAQLWLSQLPAEGSSADDDAPDPDAERHLFKRALDLIRAEFEDRTWQAFWLMAVEDLAAKEAASRLGMTPGAVRVAKSRVLRRLREELGDV